MSACSQSTAKQAPPVMDLPVILVNGQQIDQDLFSSEVQYHSAENFEAAVQKAGQALVIQQLLKQQLAVERSAASENSISNDGQEEETFDALIAANALYDAVHEEDCQRYYEQNLEKFKTAPILEVSHVLLAAAPDDSAGRIEKQTIAEDLIARLQEQPELFAEFATEFSECPSKETGGSLGQISNGQTVAEFERQLFTLPEGLHLQPIESRYGYHIVLLHKKIEGKQLDFNMVENQIRQYLEHRRYRQAIGDYLYRLAQNAEIEGIELKLDQSNIIIN